MQRQSLLLTSPRHLEWVIEDISALQPDEVLVQTKAGAVSIGSELPQYLGIARSAQPAHYPKMTGYESVGTVIDRGTAVTSLAIGDRVFAFYGHRTHGIVPEHKAILVSKRISDELALLAILTCDVTKSIRKLDPKPDERALVTGAGAIGLLTIAMLKAYGTRTIDVIEPLTKRQILAVQLGARQALSPQADLPQGEIYAVGFECSSRNAAFALLQSSLQREGRICILSDGNIDPLILTPAFHEKELQVVSSNDGWDYQMHARWYFEHIQDDSHNLELLFDYNTTAENLATTFENLTTGQISPIKVLVRYDSLPF